MTQLPSPKKLIRDMNEWCVKHKKYPSIRTVKMSNDMRHYQLFIRVFGSWERAILAAKLPRKIMNLRYDTIKRFSEVERPKKLIELYRKECPEHYKKYLLDDTHNHYIYYMAKKEVENENKL